MVDLSSNFGLNEQRANKRANKRMNEWMKFLRHTTMEAGHTWPIGQTHTKNEQTLHYSNLFLRVGCNCAWGSGKPVVTVAVFLHQLQIVSGS